MSDICSYKFLVIDNQDLLEINNLKRKTNQAIKHPEPVVKLDDPWHEKHDVFGCHSVLYDGQDSLFKMWYEIQIKEADQYWDKGRKQCYAISEDGIHWEKPIMNMVEVNGSTENNYIFPQMQSYDYTIIIDPSDIPQRRYKMIFQVDSEEMMWAKFHVPLCLAYSQDGIHWDCPTHVNPVLRGISDALWGFMYDPDRRKYQLFTRRVPNVPRDISLYESYDLVNWEDKGRVLVPGDEYDPADTFNFQGMIPFIYENFRLGLLNAHYSLPGAEPYEIFNKPPDDFPLKRLGMVDIQLAYSRDGQAWSRPKDRSPIILVGQADSPDSGMVFVPFSNPIIRNGDTWIYYRAIRHSHNWWSSQEYMKKHNGENRDARCAMLARMPEDHWVSLDADSKEGSFVCKPWGPPHEIFVNADAQGGSIEAELVTPYGKVVPDYSRSDCVPVTANGKNQQIKWKNGKSPWLSIAKDHLGGLLIKFYLKNAKLYSYTFTLPDANGQLERDKLNACWCENIKHRSDNWDRNSNEPAIGLPPYREPGPKE